MDEYIESIQTCFEESDKETPSIEFCQDLVDCVRAVDEYNSYSVPSARDFENIEISKLKEQIKKLEQEKENGWNAFRANVANRNNCEPSSITLHGDGSAHIRN
ncbi:MAG: hypothetical protein GY750_20780 [Lentisphaerae bacterium]|nr:hypothetical protein [Lentisphaerota bacterium]